MTIANTIVAQNTASDAGPDIYGIVISDGYNLIGDTSGMTITLADSDLFDVDPLLGPLDDNGGPTLTHALLSDSPALDAGDPDPVDPPPTDQRGAARIVDGDDNGTAIMDIGAFEYTPPGIQEWHIFYNNSAFDGNDAAANALDDDAIVTDKLPLGPGETATFANYTSYSRGINGIMVDIASLPDDYTPVPADFEFHTGNDDDPAGWDEFTAPITFEVRQDVPAVGTDRVTIIWADHDPANPDTTAVAGRWLEVTVKAGTGIGLTAPDVFYFGNMIAEAGNSPSDAKVTTADLLLARNNPRVLLDAIDVTFRYDYDRDRQVNATDVLLARNNQTSFFNELSLIDLSGVAAEAQGAPLADLAWLSELDQAAAYQRPADKDDDADTVDLLLASY